MRTAAVLLAIALLAGIGYSVFQLRDENRPIGSENLIGAPPPEFAAPLAGSGIEADSNITTRDAASRSGANAACDVKLEGAFVSCDDLGERAVIVFWSLRKPECVDQIDELQKAFAGDDSVDVVAVSFNDEIDDVERVARERGWTIPVAVDRDGAASIIYRAAGCPTIFFVRDGVIDDVRLATLGAAELKREIETRSGR